MLKRTMGRFLLTVLVITGLAGTINDNSLSKQERRSAISLMKDTRSELLKNIKGLTEVQLNFKAAPDRWSIKDCMYHIAISEEKLWGMMEMNLKSAANPEKRSEIKLADADLVKVVEDRSKKVKTMEPFEPKNTPYKSLEDALNAYKNMRAEHIKYLKTTTEDLRNHVVAMPFGSIDCYQFCLFIAAHNNRHMQQIQEVMADPNFPK